MKCKRCKREIPDNSMFCNWCGHKQLTQANEVRVPTPKRKGETWYAQVMVKGERQYVSANSEEEYYAKAKAFKSGVLEMKKAAPKLSLGTAIDKFINDNDSVLSPSTINAYRSYRKTRFQDYMDDDANTINYQQMVNEESRTVKPKTVHNAWRLVTASLRHAGVPAPTINLPKSAKQERPWLDYEQILTLLSACKGKPYELGIILALHGLRRSELLHLTANDVDMENGIIHVRGSSVIGEGNKLVDKDTNKNATSTRDVNIVIPRLNDLVADKMGKLVTTNPTTLYGSINTCCRNAGLPEVGVHGLRHSYISLCFHLGWDMQTVMRQGGYSNLQTVNNVYRHLAKQDAENDINKMISFFAQSASKS